MTRRKPVPKTPEQSAEEHWRWLEMIIFTQMKLTMRLFQDGFVHGYKHGKEDTLHGICSKPQKK